MPDPEEGYRYYWRGVGDVVSVMFDTVGKVLEGEENLIRQGISYRYPRGQKKMPSKHGTGEK